MYLPNLSMPVDITLSDPDLEKADPTDKERIYKTKFKQENIKLCSINHTKIDNIPMRTQ